MRFPGLTIKGKARWRMFSSLFRCSSYVCVTICVVNSICSMGAPSRLMLVDVRGRVLDQLKIRGDTHFGVDGIELDRRA